MSCHDFDTALLRRPGRSVVNGLTAGNGPAPTYEGVLAEHQHYADALAEAGVTVEMLEPLEAFPDSVFVEDPALVFAEGAILLRPGAASRAGEVAEIAPVLRGIFDTVLELPAPGFADGGDVLSTPKGVMIGLSARTDREGAERFAALAAELGRSVRIVEPPAGTLHLKTASSLIDERTVIATPALVDAGLFGDLDVIVTPEGEEAAANLLRINETALVGVAYPVTAALIESRGLRVARLPVVEIAKIDAGLSCMSLRWREA